MTSLLLFCVTVYANVCVINLPMSHLHKYEYAKR